MDINYCIETYKKYGDNQLYNAIVSSLDGDYGYFTNGKVGYRDIMSKTDFSKYVSFYCQMIIKTHGNGIQLTDNLYENCTNVIRNIVFGQYSNQTVSKIM